MPSSPRPSSTLTLCLTAWLAACAEPPVDEAVVVPDDPEPAPFTEPLEVAPATPLRAVVTPLGTTLSETIGPSLAAVDATRHAHVDAEGQAWLVDEFQGPPVALAPAALAGGTWLDDGSALLSLDGELAVWDGTALRDSPLDEAIPFPTESLTTGPFARWLTGAGRLVRLADGRATELTVQDRLLSAWAPAPDGAVWLATPELLGVDALDPELAVLDYRAEPVRDVTVDARGVVWAITEDGTLLARRHHEAWARFALPDDAVALAGHPDVGAVWVRTESSTFVHTGGAFSPVVGFDGEALDALDGDWLGLDEIGRLLVRDGDALARISLGLPTAFVGARPDDTDGLRPGEPLATRTRVGLVLTTAPGLTEQSLTAWVDDRPIPLADGARDVVLDPDGLDTGDHALRVVRRVSDGAQVTTHTSVLPFRIGELPAATWDDDIAVLASERCGACHSGASLTVLETREQWRARIDDIVDQVSDGAMPLGGPALTPDDIARIRGWKLGGFP